MLNRLGELYGVPVFETGVGFKYIAPKFREVDALIGGEESGGYAFRGHVPERDGILSGLYLLDFMARTGLTPSGLVDLLFERVGPHYYRRVDAPLPPERRSEMEATTRRAEPHELGGRRVDRIVRTDGTKFVLQGGDWLLIRFSGTEPLVRIYCETTSAESVDPLLEAGQRLVGLHP
jgi:phosphomannomutase